MQNYGTRIVPGGGYGGDHKTPLPTLKFREKPEPPPSPTQLRFPSDIPATKIRRLPPNHKGKKLGRRDDNWVHPSALPVATVDKMVELYYEGKTALEIAGIVGCARSTVSNYLKARGVNNRKNKVDIDMNRLRELRALGLSQRRIGEILNVSGTTVAKYLRKDELDGYDAD